MPDTSNYNGMDPETTGLPPFPENIFPQPELPLPPFPAPSRPDISYYAQVRFLNASTGGRSLDVYLDGQRILSGSAFATVSAYIQVSDGFHTITIRQASGQTLYQQTLAFISGEKSTMVILDTAAGVTLSKVSDMGCTNVPSGFGCFRVANMSYAGSSFDVRTFNNQLAFSGVGYREVTSYKQISAGNYTFFVTGSQFSVAALAELPILVLSAIVGGSSCPSCTVANPLLTFNLNVRAGRAYTSYLIGTPWSNLFRVFTLED